jgi:hypothetical protein
MFSKYITRNGSIALINGISQYYSFGQDRILLSGTVNEELCSWDKNGKARINQVIGLDEPHELDLVDWIEE